MGGETVTLVPFVEPRKSTLPITTSGSIAASSQPAKVAEASRIWVEGLHDAALVEKVWGDDLRDAGIVVEPLGGVDDLVAAVAEFGPASHRRLGILLDHLVHGTKESREAAAATGPHVLIAGHPFVDIWAAIKPSAVGIDAWPDVPLGESWKDGICLRLGAEAPAAFWRRVLASVRDWRDLDVSLINAVERLIDFVTETPGVPTDA